MFDFGRLYNLVFVGTDVRVCSSHKYLLGACCVAHPTPGAVSTEERPLGRGGGGGLPSQSLHFSMGDRPEEKEA